MTKKPNKPMKPVPARKHPVSQLYLGVVAALEARRIELGISHMDLCERAEIGPCRWSNILRPVKASGRQAHWCTLAKVVDVLYPRGAAFNVIIEPMLVAPRMRSDAGTAAAASERISAGV